MLARLSFVFAITLVCSSAQETQHAVRATGEATISIEPDRADISLAVETEAKTAQNAEAQNAAITTAVLAAVKPVAGGGATVKTGGYSLAPQYVYDRSTSKQQLSGYRATNEVEVTLNDISRTGKLIDAAVAAGATNVNGIGFTLQDASAVHAAALAQAARKARDSAVAIAKALDLHVTGVVKAETVENAPIRPVAMARAAIQSVTTPIEPGTIDVNAVVAVTLGVQ